MNRFLLRIFGSKNLFLFELFSLNFGLFELQTVLAAQPLLQGLLGGVQPPGDEEPLPILAPHLLAAITTTTGGEAREEELVGVPQKELSFKVDEERRRRLVEGLGEEEVEERARLMSFTLPLGDPQAGTWLTVAPILALGLHMRPQEFVLAARYRLGMPEYTHAGPCPACRQHGDEYGRHAMNCGGSGERIGRYHHLRNHLHEVAVAAGLGLIFLIFIFPKLSKMLKERKVLLGISPLLMPWARLHCRP